MKKRVGANLANALNEWAEARKIEFEKKRLANGATRDAADAEAARRRCEAIIEKEADLGSGEEFFIEERGTLYRLRSVGSAAFDVSIISVNQYGQ